MLFFNLVQPIDARIASLESLFQMRPRSHVLVPWPMKFDARLLQQLLQIQFAPFLAPSSPGLGRQGLPSGRVLSRTVLRSPTQSLVSKSSKPGGRCNLSVSVGRRPRFFRAFLLADRAVPSIISATLSPNMGSPPKGSSPQSTSGVIVLGVAFFFFAFFLGTGVFFLGVTKRRRFFAFRRLSSGRCG